MPLTGPPRPASSRAERAANGEHFFGTLTAYEVPGWPRIITIEYEVHGAILATGATYGNRFCSIIRIENRKIAHWRDYMDSLAAWNALTAPGRVGGAPCGEDRL